MSEEFTEKITDTDHIVELCTPEEQLKPEDVSPVIHAHWFESYWSGTGTECSNCGGVVSACDMDYQDVIHDFEYCPYCGAKMDGEVL